MEKYKKYMAFLVLGLCLSFAVAYAEDDTQSGNTNNDTESNLGVMNGARQDVRELRDQIKTQKDKAKEEIKTLREKFQQELEIKQREARDKKVTQMTELKAKLEKIKDEKKKTSVTRITLKLDQINGNTTNHYADKINQMEKVLNNIKTRTDKTAAKGVDVTLVRTAITNAENLIASTRTAITTQAAKVYSGNITTESTLKTAMKTARDLLKTDLDKLKDTVKSTHNAVKNAATELAKIPGVDDTTSDNKVEDTKVETN